MRAASGGAYMPHAGRIRVLAHICRIHAAYAAYMPHAYTHMRLPMPHAYMRRPPIRICTHVYAGADAGGGGIGDARPSAWLQPVALLSLLLSAPSSSEWLGCY
jgi:hypothetical protein